MKRIYSIAILAIIATGISLPIIFSPQISDWYNQLDSTEEHRGEIVDKYSYVTMYKVGKIWHTTTHYRFIIDDEISGDEVTIYVGLLSTYSDYSIGDSIIVYQSGRIEPS